MSRAAMVIRVGLTLACGAPVAVGALARGALETGAPAIATSEKWSAPERLSAEPELSSHPDIAADIFGHAHVVWQNKQPAIDRHNIVYRAWDRESWGEAQLVNPGG